MRNSSIIFAKIAGKDIGIISSSLLVIAASLFIAFLWLFKIAYFTFNFVSNWKYSKVDYVFNELLLIDIN